MLTANMKSNRNTLLAVGPDAKKECIILDVSSFLQHILMYKPWKTESQLIRIVGDRGSVKVWPVLVWYEGLHDVDCSCPVWCLIQQGEGDCVSERPLQDTVMWSWQQLDVEGNMGVFPSTITIEKKRSLKFITSVR